MPVTVQQQNVLPLTDNWYFGGYTQSQLTAIRDHIYTLLANDPSWQNANTDTIVLGTILDILFDVNAPTNIVDALNLGRTVAPYLDVVQSISSAWIIAIDAVENTNPPNVSDAIIGSIISDFSDDIEDVKTDYSSFWASEVQREIDAIASDFGITTIDPVSLLGIYKNAWSDPFIPANTNAAQAIFRLASTELQSDVNNNINADVAYYYDEVKFKNILHDAIVEMTTVPGNYSGISNLEIVRNVFSDVIDFYRQEVKKLTSVSFVSVSHAISISNEPAGAWTEEQLEAIIPGLYDLMSLLSANHGQFIFDANYNISTKRINFVLNYQWGTNNSLIFDSANDPSNSLHYISTYNGLTSVEDAYNVLLRGVGNLNANNFDPSLTENQLIALVDGISNINDLYDPNNQNRFLELEENQFFQLSGNDEMTIRDLITDAFTAAAQSDQALRRDITIVPFAKITNNNGLFNIDFSLRVEILGGASNPNALGQIQFVDLPYKTSMQSLLLHLVDFNHHFLGASEQDFVGMISGQYSIAQSYLANVDYISSILNEAFIAQNPSRFQDVSINVVFDADANAFIFTFTDAQITDPENYQTSATASFNDVIGKSIDQQISYYRTELESQIGTPLGVFASDFIASNPGYIPTENELKDGLEPIESNGRTFEQILANLRANGDQIDWGSIVVVDNFSGLHGLAFNIDLKWIDPTIENAPSDLYNQIQPLKIILEFKPADFDQKNIALTEVRGRGDISKDILRNLDSSTLSEAKKLALFNQIDNVVSNFQIKISGEINLARLIKLKNEAFAQILSVVQDYVPVLSDDEMTEEISDIFGGNIPDNVKNFITKYPGAISSLLQMFDLTDETQKKLIKSLLQNESFLQKINGFNSNILISATNAAMDVYKNMRYAYFGIGIISAVIGIATGGTAINTMVASAKIKKIQNHKIKFKGARLTTIIASIISLATIGVSIISMVWFFVVKGGF